MKVNNRLFILSIAILMGLVCVNVSHGMDSTSLSELRRTGQEQGLGDLPKDIHHEIVKKAIALSENLKGLVDAVNIAGVLQGVCYDNIQKFTDLMNILAKKFRLTRKEMAQAFHTKTGKTYLKNNEHFLNLLNFFWYRLDDLEKAKEAINLSMIDPNFTWKISPDYEQSDTLSFLMHACRQFINYSGNKNVLAIMKLLLNNGANPNNRHIDCSAWLCSRPSTLEVIEDWAVRRQKNDYGLLELLKLYANKI